MIPIRNELPGRTVPVMTILFIAACTTVYIMQMTSLGAGGLIPLDFMHSVLHPGQGLPRALAALVSSFFVHGGIFHLLSNMWYLWIFGTMVERNIGVWRFALVYLSCGILSMLIQVGSSPFSSVPIVGASGAIAGIMGVNLVSAPLARILVWVPPIFLFRLPAFIFLLLWFGVQYMNLGRQSGAGGGIAWWAHVGGYVSGILFAVVLPARSKRRT